MEPPENPGDFIARQNDGQALRSFRAFDALEPRQLDAENLLVEEEQRALGLILGRAGYVARNSEVG